MAKLFLKTETEPGAVERTDGMKSIEKPLFNGAKLKIKRANRHIQELIHLVHSFSHPDRYRMKVEKDVNTGEHILKFDMIHQGIDDIPLIVGDVIHNLRTALDHMVCELITRAGKPLTKRTRFPLWETRKEAVAAIGGIIQGVSVEVITAFLENVQPYRRGNPALFTLHALDIADKHRLLVPVLSVAGITFTEVRDGKEVSTIAFGVTRREEAYVIEVRPGAKIQGERNPMLHILFDEVKGIEGVHRQSVIPMLHHLRQIVSGTVQEIEGAVLDSKEWFSL